MNYIEKDGKAYLDIDHKYGVDIHDLELSPDREVRFWILYKPECDELVPNNANIHLWMRRADYIHLTEDSAKLWLEDSLGLTKDDIKWERHELFPELRIGTDKRGFRWFLEPIPLHI